MAKDDVIPLMRPLLPSAEAVLPRLQRMDESGWYSNFGPQTRELEQRFADLLGVDKKQVVTASSATRGLEGALSVSSETRWTLPSWTFAATVGAALQVGKGVEFVDIDAETWWARSGGPNRIVTSPFGVWREGVINTGDEVVVDAAATLGLFPTLTDIGPGTAVVFSLGATKVLGSGEGGVVVFGDPDRAVQFRSWSRHGFGKDRIAHTAGSNAKLSEMAAAYAHTALDLWEEERHQWMQAKRYAQGVELAVGLSPTPVSTLEPTPYWIVSFSDAQTRRLAQEILTDEGVQHRMWWESGCHTMAGFDAVARPDLSATDLVASKYLGLPMFRGFGAEEAERVHDALSKTRDVSGAW